MRTFYTGFESLSDLNPNWYISPMNQNNTAFHSLSGEIVAAGASSHKGWVTGANVGTPHRGYPTMQFYKDPGGGYNGPVLVELSVWLDVLLSPGEWFSFLTLCSDPSDNWSKVVVLNVSPAGYVYFYHVPVYNQSIYNYQNNSYLFPMRQWNKIAVLCDFDSLHGRVLAWVNGTLVSDANVSGGDGKLEQFHAGLYCSNTVNRAVVYNDDLRITELF